MARDIPHGSIEKRGNRYRASYYDPTGALTASGRPRKVYAPHSFLARADAEEWLITEWNLVRWGNWTHPKDRAAAKARAALTLDDYLDRFITARGYRVTTEATMRSVYDNRIRGHLGSRPLADITAADVREWQAALRANPDTAGTAKRNYDAFVMLSTMFSQAIEHDLIEVNPCSGVKLHRPRPKAKVLPTVEQVAELVATMPPCYRFTTAFLAWTGLRIGEAIGVERGDFHTETTGGVTRHYVYVRRNVTRQAGEWIVGPGKTEAARRRVPIPPHIVPLMERHMREFVGPESSAPVCVNQDGGRMVRQRYDRVLKLRGEKVGLPDISPHVLRHFAGTQVSRMGGGVPDVMAWLGHTDPAMALHYAKAAQGRAEQLAESLSDLAGEGTP